MKTPVSPLTGGTRVELVRRYATVDLQRRWRQRFAINIRAELPNTGEILHWRCSETEIEFFSPGDVCGSPVLYEQLSRFGWYHDLNRWEFDAALPWLRDSGNLLEVGCGDGAFLDLLTRCFRGQVTGIELNPVTAARAREKGHRIVEQPMEDQAVRERGPFDAICSFQVLEHVPNPLAFAQRMVSLLRPGGVMVLGVPNARCFVRHWKVNLLDLPPHHMTRWTAFSLKSLASLLDVELLAVESETLSKRHAVDYIEAHAQRVLPLAYIPRIIAILLGPLLGAMPIRQSITGHTLLGVYRKPM
jgi:2-polyprenyl-3-methyl-5-hydroxy-6-metoxy-1,4-benzoquinol methylase